MKALKRARKDKQLDNFTAEEKLRWHRNRLASQHFKLNNYNSLIRVQKESIDVLIKG